MLSTAAGRLRLTRTTTSRTSLRWCSPMIPPIALAHTLSNDILHHETWTGLDAQRRCGNELNRPFHQSIPRRALTLIDCT